MGKIVPRFNPVAVNGVDRFIWFSLGYVSLITSTAQDDFVLPLCTELPREALTGVGEKFKPAFGWTVLFDGREGYLAR